MNLAYRNLKRDSSRMLLSIAGVALAVTLILVLQGFLGGMYRQISAYLDHVPGSLVVAEKGISNLLGATSLLPDAAVRAVGGVQGVSRAAPIISQFMILDLHGKKQPAYLVGYEPSEGGGPWRIVSGRNPLADREVVFDRVLARRHDLKLGDAVEIAGQGFTIVGFSEGTASWMTSFIFIKKSAGEALVGIQGATSFILVEPSPGVGPEELKGRLGTLPGVDALLKTEMIANDSKLFARVFSAPLRMMVGIALLVGSLVVGLVIYTATVEKLHEFGVLKAIGARNGILYRVVTTQALIASSAGSFFGLGAAFGAAALIMALRPQFLIVYEPAFIVQALIAGLVMALLGALLPVRVISALAPADVFRR